MDLEQQLGAALAPCRPAPALRTAVLARIEAAAKPASTTHRRPRRTILFGTMLAVAAAASMLGIQLADVQQIVATSSSAQSAPPALIEPVAGAADTQRADTGSSAAAEPTTLAGVRSRTYTVQVLPLGLPGADPALQSAMHEFYTRAVSELAAVPGLVLLPAGDAASSADYRLTFNGGVEVAGTVRAMLQESGQAQAVPAPMRMWRMQLSVESRRAPPVRGLAGPDAASGASTITLVNGHVVSTSSQTDVVDLNVIPSNLLERMDVVTGGNSATYGSGATASTAMAGAVNLVLDRRVEGVRLDIDVPYTQQPDGYTVVYRNVVTGLPAQNPADLAATEIERLRMAVLPIDAELSGKLRAQLLDASLPYDQRFRVLQLLTLQEEGTENPDTIRGALALLAAGPNASTRAAVWRVLRGKPRPAVLYPLLDLLGTVRDATFKLEILTTLAADYEGEPAALAALNSIAANDPDALVRNVAERGVSGESAWREYVATTIQDVRLTPAERFAPLAYLIQAGQVQDVRSLLDEQALQALVAVLPPLLEDPANQQGVNYLLGNLGVNSPLMVDLALAGLDRKVELSTRRRLVSLLGQHRDEPRVRQRLEQIAAGDDPQLRALVAPMLRMPATPGR